jgi:transcriptional regulator of NAD metabolism
MSGKMSTDERREQLSCILKDANEALSGTVLAKKLGVSRQIIVGDISILKASGMKIVSTYKGYILENQKHCSRIFKVRHLESETEDELTGIIDLGGTVVDVFVWHKVYGKIDANLNLQSRYDIQQFMEQLKSGKSTTLMNVTSGYHYHTVEAASEEILDMIEHLLAEKGFLVPE